MGFTNSTIAGIIWFLYGCWSVFVRRYSKCMYPSFTRLLVLSLSLLNAIHVVCFWQSFWLKFNWNWNWERSDSDYITLKQNRKHYITTIEPFQNDANNGHPNENAYEMRFFSVTKIMCRMQRLNLFVYISKIHHPTTHSATVPYVRKKKK